VPIFVQTGKPGLDALPERVRGFLAADTLDLVVDGRPVRGYRSPDARSIWIRDFSDMLRGVKYFEKDVTSAIDHFAGTQSASGRIFDYFTTFPEKLPSERENWTKYVRVPVEADVEYRFVKAAFLAWQATGDDDWIRALLPAIEKALVYGRTHPWRWHEETGLVKRAYTIDTWDFAYTGGTHDWLQFQIDEHTHWGIFHGDNTGTYEAYALLAGWLERFGDDVGAARWRERARRLRAALDRVAWNGRFYTHFVKLDDLTIPGVDEAAQLSLSNPMAINRGCADHAKAVAILEEYRRRRGSTGAFAEWFSIDPPFPDGIFGDERIVRGAYVNGGIMPLVGGELARAAFEHGFEADGVDILERYERLTAGGESHLWYFPDGTPASVETSTSPDAQPTDGWGSSAMLHALVEGLAGVTDHDAGFARVRLAPRWLAAGVEDAEVRVSYAASGAGLSYGFRLEGGGIRLEIEGTKAAVDGHVLLPPGARAARVEVGGADMAFREVEVEESVYVDFRVQVESGAHVAIELAPRG